MKKIFVLATAVIFTMVLMLSAGINFVNGAEKMTEKAIFFVKWYDAGKEALDGLKGVQKVEKGFRNFKEINTVYYDPSVITIEEMEMALKKVGTYLGTL